MVMWELIEANKRKSILIFIGMGVCLLVLGFLIGAIFFPPDGGLIGLLITSSIWLVWSIISYFTGDSLLLAVSKAREVDHEVHPQLFNIVEEMKIAANLPVMPKIYIIPSPAPNAFATGIRPEKSTIAVTAGLLSVLNRDELQGVVAHEMSHIMNRDVLFVSFAGVLFGSIALVSELFLRGMWFSSRSSNRRYSGKMPGLGGHYQMALVIVGIAFAVLAPIIVRLLYFAFSRRREYLADACAARLTRYPAGLASALRKIAGSHTALASANKVTAAMYIVNPLTSEGMPASSLNMTHPPLTERVRILLAMSGGADYINFQEAYSKVTGSGKDIIPASGLLTINDVPIREGSERGKSEMGIGSGVRDVGDLMRAVNNFMFLVCACGLKIKLPPDFKKSKLNCPRCKREIEVPLAEFAGMAAAATVLGGDTPPVTKKEAVQKPDPEPPMIYTRKGTGWETFSCKCGRVMQISPAFVAPRLRCRDCGRKIQIKSSRSD